MESSPQREHIQHEPGQEVATAFDLGGRLYSRHLQMSTLTGEGSVLRRSNKALIFSTTRLPMLARLQGKWSASHLLPDIWAPLAYEWYGGSTPAPLKLASLTPRRVSPNPVASLNSVFGVVEPSSPPVVLPLSPDPSKLANPLGSGESRLVDGPLISSTQKALVTSGMSTEAEATWGRPIFSAGTSIRRVAAKHDHTSAIERRDQSVLPPGESKPQSAVHGSRRHNGGVELQPPAGPGNIAPRSSYALARPREAGLHFGHQEPSRVERSAAERADVQAHTPEQSEEPDVLSASITPSFSPNASDKPVQRVDRKASLSKRSRASAPVVRGLKDASPGEVMLLLNANQAEMKVENAGVGVPNLSHNKGGTDAGSGSALQPGTGKSAYKAEMTPTGGVLPKVSEATLLQPSVQPTVGTSSREFPLGPDRVTRVKRIDLQPTVSNKLARSTRTSTRPVHEGSRMSATETGSGSALQPGTGKSAYKAEMTPTGGVLPKVSEATLLQPSVQPTVGASSREFPLGPDDRVTRVKQVDLQPTFSNKLARSTRTSTRPVHEGSRMSATETLVAPEVNHDVTTAPIRVFTPPDRKASVGVALTDTVANIGVTNPLTSARSAILPQPPILAVFPEVEMTSGPTSIIHRAPEHPEITVPSVGTAASRRQAMPVSAALTDIGISHPPAAQPVATVASSHEDLPKPYWKVTMQPSRTPTRLEGGTASRNSVFAEDARPHQLLDNGSIGGALHSESPMSSGQLAPLVPKERVSEIHRVSVSPVFALSRAKDFAGLPGTSSPPTSTSPTGATTLLRRSATSPLIPDRTHLQRAPNPVSAAADTFEATIPIPPASATREEAPATVDFAQIAEHVYRMLVDRLASERSRRGM